MKKTESGNPWILYHNDSENARRLEEVLRARGYEIGEVIFTGDSQPTVISDTFFIRGYSRIILTFGIDTRIFD